MLETMRDYSDTIFDLVEYELWCNLQLVNFLAGLSDDECKRDFGFGLRTPHRTIFHIADVMQGWSSCVGPVIEKVMAELGQVVVGQPLLRSASRAASCYIPPTAASRDWLRMR